MLLCIGEDNQTLYLEPSSLQQPNKSQRTPIPLLRLSLSSPGLTLLGSKFALCFVKSS